MLSVLDADPRGAISLEQRFFFNRVPKSANTSVIVSLAKIGGKASHSGSEAKLAFIRPSEIGFEQLAELEDFFKFTFVRNPYTRILSSYLDKITTGIKARYIRDNRENGILPSFSQFCQYLNSGGLYMNAHWAPQTSLMLLPIDQFDFIGRVESFSRDLSFVASHVALNNPIEPPKRHFDHRSSQTNADARIEQYYDDQCLEIVRRLYRSDFECFGYAM